MTTGQLVSMHQNDNGIRQSYDYQFMLRLLRQRLGVEEVRVRVTHVMGWGYLGIE